jgi:hypothetical protein
MSKSNIFAEQERKQAEEAKRWGLSDLPGMDRYRIEMQALRIIGNKEIVDDEEKQKIYDDVKRQFLEHREETRAHRETAKTTEANSDEIAHQPKDDTTEFEKGYQKFWKDQEEIEAYEATQYRHGYKVAEQEWLERRRASKQAAIEYAESDSTDPAVRDPIREELQQLKEGFKALDERLKALEKYTKE